MNILIKNVLLDGAAADIFIENGTILEISPACSRNADRVIDGRNKAALPSLINGHTHAAMTLFRGFADDMPLKAWLEEKIWVLEAKLTPDDVYWGARLACLEMIKGGTTSFADMYFFGNDLAKATKEMGMRGVVAPTIFDFPTNAAQSVDEYISTTEDFIKNWLHDDLITPSIGPHAPYTCSPETLKRAQKTADKFDISMQIHVAETEWEVKEITNRYGKTPIEHLDSLGFLSVGSSIRMA